MARGSRLLAGLLLLDLALSACAPATVPSPAPSSSAAATAKPVLTAADSPIPSPTVGRAASARELRGDAAAWERLKEVAKREGQAVVAGPGFPGMRQALVEGFQQA